ncbi:CDP-diacylglycerol--serine O-phosphatidyltransferase [Pseudobacteriovorax antillogorgiicola]|uniref:CDP-diacylglycerol--serine O-phosphatidyltransferase n=1 Tax=Pseudobacteriovorax antillogorgiicola TaxID=1513793 RepID=A0A1Y6B3J2_9BACT|nr:CDP-diacylglycerol--serine O-phosphatidyltransferase [Pseudobacteriovorax antillogorgiicola]TCS59549.1 CDP-diacylglycerol--serine O-phosphatidyltransferase [Pseudobacteriovorax antillogorgiicola]SME87749.1 CDP-diacylglycerol--serine O-phosphatidyltransferase [Pseudobacteriovorax antillogorgiicola]
MKFKGARRKKPLGGAVYILPNLFTTGNLFFGFFAIIKCLQEDFMWASGAILLAAVFDMLDGRVARLTGGTSEFGVQYDSLCDLVSFGVAPAFIMYMAGLDGLGRLGWIICFMFMACGALRLARFNVQSSIGQASGDFVGLPIPMAAGVIACFVAVWSGFEVGPNDFTIVKWVHSLLNANDFRIAFFCVAGVGLALAMVTNIPYRSHKTLNIKGIKPFRILVLGVALTGLVAYQPELFGFLLFAGYAVSGPLEWMFGWTKAVDDDDIFEPGSGNVLETAGERGYPSEADKNDNSGS